MAGRFAIRRVGFSDELRFSDEEESSRCQQRSPCTPAFAYALFAFFFGSWSELPAAVACLGLEAAGVEVEIDLRSLDQPHVQRAFRDLDLPEMIALTESRRQAVAVSDAGGVICDLGDLRLPAGQTKR